MWWFYPFNSDKLDYLGKEWDVAKLWRVFHDSVVQDIQKIPIAGIGREDYLAWNHTKNGIFSLGPPITCAWI